MFPRSLLANEKAVVSLQEVRPLGICDCWDDFSGHQEAFAVVVSGHVARNGSEARRERVGASEGFGVGKL